MTEPLGIDKWYGYKKFYDFKTGKNIYPKNLTQEGIDQVDAEAAHLKGLLWMSYGKVSFAVRAPWVIGRFCIPTGAQTPPDKKTPVDNFRNVNDVCEGSWKYNRCYNDMALRFHNEKRALHANTPNLKFDTGIAQTIQFHMDKDGFDGTIQDLGPYSSCLQQTYVQDKITYPNRDPVQFTNEASAEWYQGRSQYDPERGMQISTGSTPGYNLMLQYTQMVWKNTSKVGFGVKDAYVIAWYCDTKGN